MHRLSLIIGDYAIADFDFGYRGPQSVPGSQIEIGR